MLRHVPYLLSLVVVAAAACGETTPPQPGVLNFDRPVDVAFACYGGLRLLGDNGSADPDDEITTTAQPVEACNIRSGDRGESGVVPVPPGQENLTMMGGAPIIGSFWYAFVLQSATGTVVVAEFPTKPSASFAPNEINVRDADALTPGNNAISVGEDPIAIAGDTSGCWQVVANAGSCDLSALEVNTVLDRTADVNVQRLDVKNGSGARIDARPAAMAMAPGVAQIGQACPAQAQGVAYIAYPGCQLVAAVDLATSTIVSGVRFDATGPSIVPQAELATLSCPSECDGGAVGMSGTRPVALDVEEMLVRDVATKRLLIGADNSNVVTLVELDEATSLPTSVQPIPLEDPTNGSLGVTAVALGPQIGMGGFTGSLNDDIAIGGQFNFAYAITTDDTIRVVALNGAIAPGGPAVDFVECDTQVDPRLIYDNRNVRELSCFPVGAAGTPARRPGARSPGVQLPTESAVPLSIEIFQSAQFGSAAPGPTRLVGYFGVITATNGAAFVMTVDDDDRFDFEDPNRPLDVDLTQAIAHQLRDAIPNREDDNITDVDPDSEREDLQPICAAIGADPDSPAGNEGGVRSTGTPTRTIPGAVVNAERASQLPTLRQLLCTGYDGTQPVTEVGFAAPAAVRDLVYQDLRSLVDETWTMTWEGRLSQDTGSVAIDGPAVRVAQLAADNASSLRVIDQSQPFCDMGVQPWDIVQLRGCDASVGDAECPLGYTCFVHPQSQLPNFGACMLENEAERLADACRDFLTSNRRFTVGRSSSGELRLLPRKVVLRTTPVDGCTSDAQCEDLGRYAVELGTATQPKDAMPEDRLTWACRADSDRAPIDQPGQTNMRCVATCGDNADCATGHICSAGVCMEGVVPPQACVNAPQRYEVRAGEAFAVLGTRSGYVHSTIRDPATGLCVSDPDAHPFDIGRIPLDPPACDPTADPRTGRRPDGTFEPTPSALTVEHAETVRAYASTETCTLADPATRVETRQAPAIRFRNRGLNLTMVDPTYPGDARCIGDRAGNDGNIPLVFPNYQVTWRQTAGFTPLVLPIQPAFPVKVVRGPTQSIWVVDEGDTDIPNTARLRGQVYRVEIQTLSPAFVR